MRLHTCDAYPVPLPAGHRFPMEKYALVRDALLAEGAFAPHELVDAAPATDAELLRAHTPAWVRASTTGEVDPYLWRRVGFPWSPALALRCRASAGGTLGALDDALREGAGGVLAGGTHHAGPDSGEGYCVYNDLAVAALAALEAHGVRRVAIVDLDVHQGNGTALILGGREDCFLLSVHGARNYPFRKVDGTLDIALEDGAGDTVYLAAVREGLAQVFRWRPDVVLFQAGVDPLAGDRLGRLDVSMDGLAARDAMVYTECRRYGTPVVVTMGGGYALPVERTVAAHAQTFRLLREWMG